MDSNENEEKNIQDLNKIPPKDHLKTCLLYTSRTVCLFCQLSRLECDGSSIR